MRHDNIQDLFSRAAEKYSGKAAIEGPNREVTYGALERESNNLANFLTSSGVSKNAIIALLIEDSVEVTKAIIAILKAGCVFVPLDPSIPDGRLKAMVAVLNPEWFLIESKHAERLLRITSDDGPAARVLCVDGEVAAGYPADRLIPVNDYRSFSNPERPPIASDPDRMCYVYFTSGSTGRPKGIAGRLKAIDHFIRWEIKTFQIDSHARVSQLTSPSFDAFLRDIFAPLCAGGLVCVPESRNTILDARRLVGWINDRRINLVHCVPSVFRSIVNEELSLDYFPELKYILMAGEPLLPADVRRWFEVFGDRIQLVNLYGPSETTMTKFFYVVKQADKELPSIPIGKPMRGAKALIVDQKGKPCRPGKVGEIYIRTPFLTLGYYNEPELTGEAFVQNPFSDDAGDIVYKTGDLGRVLADGNFEFLGRKDLQVKVRGVRVELAEVENALRTHEQVKDVAVVDRDDSSGNKYLCAYVVLRGEVESSALRSHLSEQLPDYMLPSTFVLMDALPRTFSGKVDRRALPAPDQERRALHAQYVAPRTPTEEMVASIWAQVLGVKRVGAHDNFFDLGGHSLRITQVVSRLSKAFQIELPLRAFFETPTVAGLADRIDKAVLSGSKGDLQPILPIPRDGELQLSFAQQRLWFLDKLEPDSAFYNIPAAVRIRGSLDAAVLERSLNEVVGRHETLRTSFDSEGGRPVLRIAPSLKVEIPVVDLQGLSEQESEARIRRLASEEAHRPFDIARAPLLRVTLLKLGREDHALIVTMHHIISDNWSVGIFIQETAALYMSLLKGEPSPLKELAVQYVDFAAWQRGWLVDEVIEGQLSYWRKQLGGAATSLRLPTDRPRPRAQTFRGAGESLLVDRHLTASINELSRREGVSLFMTLLAAFYGLLYRYSAQEDISVGTPIAGRNRLETEELIGFFANTLVLRADLSGAPSFRQLLARVRETCLGAFANQDIPFERLVEEMQPERSLSRTPLFQVMFVFQNAPTPRIELPGLTLSQVPFDTHTAAFDIVLGMLETEQGLVGLLDYNTDLFEPETIKRMLRHFHILLEGITADPDRALLDLPLLTEADHHRALVEWNATAAAFDRPHLVHRLFEAQVERTPDLPAVTLGGESLSYSELNARANQLAHHLRGLGVGPESRVGVCFERSTDLIVSLLAVFKAGGAYVPLDPNYPRERLTHMIDDSGASLILTLESFVGAFSDSETPVVRLDEERQAVARNGLDNLPSIAEEDNLAYVFYTSGSTGLPKGVMITHRGLCNTLLWRIETFRLSKSDRILQNIPFTFDPSAWQIFGALLSGATLVLVPPELHQDARYIVRLLAEQDITIVDFPPSLLNVLLDEEGLTRCESLRCVFCGGEPLTAELKDRFFERLRADLYNQYGPTEAGIDATYWKADAKSDRPIAPIGGPIANKQVYVLNPNLQPVPVGVIGELHIAGAGLARGYINRPELTGEKFIPNPFGGEPGGRLYRTGDFARYLPDGTIEFVGRIDNQVKIRGNRVEIGEIEAAIKRHPAVRDCAVVASDNGIIDRALFAFVVASDASLSSSQLRSSLALTLPDFMIPSRFNILDALPLTPNGKVDRRALYSHSDHSLPAPALSPRTPVEQAVSDVWADVLGLNGVSALDNFFELGGHSLLATQIVSRLRDQFSVELELRSVFETPTVAGLAQKIESALRDHQGLQVPPIKRVNRESRLPLSFAQQRLWFFDQMEPGSAVYNIHAAVRLEGELEVWALEASLRRIIQRHEVLRTKFEAEGGEPEAVIIEQASFELPLLDLSGLEEDRRQAEARRLAAEQGQKGFDLREGGLIRARLVKMSQREHVFVMTMHHIISDGWSMGVLISELYGSYDSFVRGKQPPDEKPEVGYVDYAAWQREWLAGEELDRQMGYWRRVLEGAPGVLELPTDRRRPAIQRYEGSREEVRPGEEVSRAIREMSVKEQVTTYMTLLAVWKVLLWRYSGQQDIVVGTPIANRSRREVEGLIGYFANTLVIRSRVEGDKSFEEFLREVKEACVGAYAHQDIPFEKLVEEMQPVRALSHSPLFQVMFSYQSAQAASGAGAGSSLLLKPMQVDAPTAMFDLTLNLVETGKEIVGTLEYNTDLFDAATVRRMARHFETLLNGVVENPARAICDLPALSEQEQHRILVEWNATQRDYPAHESIHTLFESRAKKCPESIAASFEGRQLTFGELNRKANRLAHYLRRQGVGPEVIVGVCVERGLDMLVSLLGIMKAGGAYLPLDSEHPEQRLAFMLAEAQAPVVITQLGLRSRLPAHPCKVVQIDEDWPEISRESKANPPSLSLPDNPVYVLYTSGSTGKPKGVMITHRALANLLRSIAVEPGLTSSDKILAITTYCFDISAVELFLPLIEGAECAIVDRAKAKDPERLKAEIERVAPTVLQATPATWMLLLHTGWSNDRRIKIFCGGEAFTEYLRSQLVADGVEVWNMFGPTETTIYSAIGRVPDQGTITIGRPIANTRVYILDERMRPAPIGVAGELFIGGTGLSRGYLNRPDHTAERFVADPFSGERGARLYRTGDLARYNLNGQVEFLGRIDHQVKVRGFRIEPGEIEIVLSKHPGVCEAVVITEAEGTDAGRLIAYVVAQDQQAPAVGDLRAFLRSELPDYMVPSAFVFLDSIPLGASGKVDRRALPPADESRSPLQAAFVPPRDETERKLTEIWEAVLRAKPIGVTENFFALGGHSFLAVRLMAQVKREFERKLPLASLFQGPTIENLAHLLRGEREAARQSPLVPIQPRGSKRPLFFVHELTGSVQSYSNLARYLGPEQPIYGLRMQDLEDDADARACIEEMASRYVEAMRATQPAGPYQIGGWSFGGLVAFEMAQQLKRQGEDVTLLALFDATRPTSLDAESQLVDTATILWSLAKVNNLTLSVHEMRGLELDEQLSYVLERAKALGPLAAGIGLPFLRSTLHAIKSNLRASASYVPEVYPDQITLFRPSKISVEGLSAEGLRLYSDPALGWGELTSHAIDIHVVPGDHFTLFAEPNVGHLAQQLNACIEEGRAAQVNV